MDAKGTKKRKVSCRKLVKRPKRKGTYKPKPKTTDVPIGIGDPDLAECIFSDEEVCLDLLQICSTNVNLNSRQM